MAVIHVKHDLLVKLFIPDCRDPAAKYKNDHD